MSEARTIERYGWEAVDALCRRLARSISEPFDAIVCILRGGAVPGVILANELGIDTVAGIKVVQAGQAAAGTAPDRPYDGVEGSVLIPLNPLDLRGRRVLLVDDVLDSGETALVARREIERLGPARLAFATLQVKSYSRFRPDYFVEEKTGWLFYPWMSEREFRQMQARLDRPPEQAA